MNNHKPISYVVIFGAVTIVVILIGVIWINTSKTTKNPIITQTPKPASSIAATESVVIQTPEPDGFIQYVVKPGDNLFSIAEKYAIHPDTILWANEDVLHDNPGKISSGMTLIIPPVDGLYYEWQIGDKDLQEIAQRHCSTPEAILKWPENHIDSQMLSQGWKIDLGPGTKIFIPGGKRLCDSE
ncbi:MAG: LysM peptidoglycan-binding domain-containing protein [Chloroflexi bacterium]|nr:LysM peptidoglycan-binding domain-containing protein [Chloroflexota bacterium]